MSTTIGQVAGPTFYQLHILFDRHYEQQSELVDAVVASEAARASVPLTSGRRSFVLNSFCTRPVMRKPPTMLVIEEKTAIAASVRI